MRCWFLERDRSGTRRDLVHGGGIARRLAPETRRMSFRRAIRTARGCPLPQRRVENWVPLRQKRLWSGKILVNTVEMVKLTV